MKYETVKAVRQTFVALIFIMLNLNIEIGNRIVNFIPSFIGYFLLTQAAMDLFEDKKGEVVKIISLICLVASAVQWILNFFNIQINTVNYILSSLDLVLNLIMMYLIFAHLADMAEENDLPDTAITFRTIMAGYILTYAANYLTAILFGNGFVMVILTMLMYGIIFYSLFRIFRFAGKLEGMVK